MKPLRRRAEAWSPIAEQDLSPPTVELVLATDTMQKWAADFGGDAAQLPCPRIPEIHHEQLALLASRFESLNPAQRGQLLATVDRILWSCMELSTDEIFEVSTA